MFTLTLYWCNGKQGWNYYSSQTKQVDNQERRCERRIGGMEGSVRDGRRERRRTREWKYQRLSYLYTLPPPKGSASYSRQFKACMSGLRWARIVCGGWHCQLDSRIIWDMGLWTWVWDCWDHFKLLTDGERLAHCWWRHPLTRLVAYKWRKYSEQKLAFTVVSWSWLW